MFHVIKMRFCKGNQCKMAIKHIFGAKDGKDALLKFVRFIEDLDIEPIDIKIFTISDLMEENGMFELETSEEVWE